MKIQFISSSRYKRGEKHFSTDRSTHNRGPKGKWCCSAKLQIYIQSNRKCPEIYLSKTFEEAFSKAEWIKMDEWNMAQHLGREGILSDRRISDKKIANICSLWLRLRQSHGQGMHREFSDFQACGHATTFHFLRCPVPVNPWNCQYRLRLAYDA